MLHKLLLVSLHFLPLFSVWVGLRKEYSEKWCASGREKGGAYYLSGFSHLYLVGGFRKSSSVTLPLIFKAIKTTQNVENYLKK